MPTDRGRARVRRAAAACLALLIAAAGLHGAAAQAPPALSELQAAAAQGQVDAQVRLAEIYLTGAGVVQDVARAADLFAAAAEGGDPRAQNGLGKLLIQGAGVDADPARGFALIEAAAEASEDPQHLYDLGLLLETGRGTAPDPARAADHYRRAAEAGLDEAAVALGVLYQDGVGVPQDPARAAELYRGPAEAGHPRAQNNLGLAYARGAGVEQDYAAAREWFEKSAAQGVPQALRNLAALYQNGFGVEADEKRAEALLRLAAQGTAEGGPAAAPLVFDPRLAAPDPAQLPDHLADAAAGDPVAQFLAGYLLATADDPARRDDRAAARLFRAAADAGLPAAMANLGVLSFEGRGTLQDYVEGYKWLSLAAVSGGPALIALRDAYAPRMTGAQITAANRAAQAHAAPPGSADPAPAAEGGN